MNPALLYLLKTSFKGWLNNKLGKFKQPKYLVTMFAVIAYFGLVFSNQLFNSAAQRPEWPEGVGLLLASLMIGMSVAATWMFTGSKGGLGLTPAESEILFAAPLSNTQLVLYRSAKSQARLLFTTIILTIFFSMNQRFPSPLSAAVGLFLLMNFFAANRVLAAFIAVRMKASPLQWILRAGIPIAILLPLLVAALDLNTVIQTAPDDGLKDAVSQWAAETARGERVAGLMQPLVFLSQSVFSHTVGAFAQAALVLVGLCVVLTFLATRIKVSVSESEIAGAAARAKALDAKRQGRGAVSTKAFRKSRFSLAPDGPAWRAIAWKNMVGMTRGIPKVAIFLFLIFSIQGVVVIALMDEGTLALKAAFVLAFLAIMFGAMGSLFVRDDLRADLDKIDIIKSLPISSRQLLRGEVYGISAAVGVPVMLLLLFAGILSTLGEVPDLSRPEMAAIALGLLLLAPAGVMTMSLMDNVYAAMFPSWARIKPGTNVQGMENFGSQLILMLFKMLGFSILWLIPGAICGGIIAAGIVAMETFWLIPVGCLIATAMVFGEGELVMRFTAPAIDKMDPSLED